MHLPMTWPTTGMGGGYRGFDRHDQTLGQLPTVKSRSMKQGEVLVQDTGYLTQL